jgi:uncharacterized membrane protein YidH (DUF202 family)
MLQVAPPEGPFVLALVAVALVVVFGFVGVVIYLEHRKEMALIESGDYPVESDTRGWILAAGLLALAVGVGQLVVSLTETGTVGPGLTLALVGVAALVYYFLRRRQDRRAVDDGTADAGE